MYLISEFSKITTIPVKTLHYYDNAGLLSPYRRDSATGYRFYNEENYQQALQLLFLRDLDFSIQETKEILAHPLTELEFNQFLGTKKIQLQGEINHKQALLKKIEENLTSPIGSQKVLSETSVTCLMVPKKRALTKSIIGSYSEVGRYIGQLYKLAGKSGTGSPFTLMYDDSYQEQATMKVCLEVTKNLTLPTKDFDLLELPIQEVLSYTHIGSYDTLGFSYKQLFDFAQTNNYQLHFPSRELYVKGPGFFFKGNPAHYRTEIQIPFTAS
ncbi:MerR family transcriptional regulator [Vagococcus salmoninarum]|uniref:MerR family transcriptional regulator n=1 Tax=Vagococcus salmoninarum TaxID=2739 RepID=UPI0028D352C5|nr:MerR family transcriptional regulator [Vagococcus salmoninarum]